MLEYFCVRNNALISNSLPFQRSMRWRDGAVHLESPETGTILQHHRNTCYDRTREWLPLSRILEKRRKQIFAETTNELLIIEVRSYLICVSLYGGNKHADLREENRAIAGIWSRKTLLVAHPPQHTYTWTLRVATRGHMCLSIVLIYTCNAYLQRIRLPALCAGFLFH